MCIRDSNKEVKLAMRSALSAKLADGELVVVKDFEFEKPSTKAAVAAMKALGLEAVSYTHLDVYKRQAERTGRHRRSDSLSI